MGEVGVSPIKVAIGRLIYAFGITVLVLAGVYVAMMIFTPDQIHFLNGEASKWIDKVMK
jgi:hypothetical protein